MLSSWLKTVLAVRPGSGFEIQAGRFYAFAALILGQEGIIAVENRKIVTPFSLNLGS